jgi:hypothetical protein
VACGSPIGDHPDGYDFGARGDAGPAAGVDAARRFVDAHKATILSIPDTSTPSQGVDCPPNATLIYVTGVVGETDVGSDLYSFDPQSGKFSLVGSMGCLTGPTHMTVDRQGTAWVVANGDLYEASTTTAKCSKAAKWTADPVRFPDFSLTFLGTTSAGDDSLYILGDTGQLGLFAVSTGEVAKLGTLTIGASGDMTTNGDGTLYFLEQAAKQTLNELDPGSAAVIQSWKTGEDSQNTQALAYYGGLFYVFIGNAVYTFDTTTGTTKPIGTAPIYVTGAGQSTCVPTDAGPPSELR